MKLIKEVQVRNDMGLHTRPATYIVKLLQHCKSQVSFTYRKETINAKSIMSLLMLAATKNSKIVITIEGEDAQEFSEKLVEAFESNFGEKI